MDSRERLRRCYYYEGLDRPAVCLRTYYPRNYPTYGRVKALMNSVAELKNLWLPTPNSFQTRWNYNVCKYKWLVVFETFEGGLFFRQNLTLVVNAPRAPRDKDRLVERFSVMISARFVLNYNPMSRFR